MIALLALSIAVALVSAQSLHTVTANAPNFSLFVFRVAQSGIVSNGANITGTSTQFSGQVQVLLVVNGVVTEQVGTLSPGAPLSGYSSRSLFDTSGIAPSSVALRFNSSDKTLTANDCNLVAFSSASTRTTCTLVQAVNIFSTPTPTCAVVNGPCTTPPTDFVGNALNSFSVVQSTEELDTRVCATSQLFVRGTAPTCVNRVRRNANPADVLASETVVLTLPQTPGVTAFTTGGKVPSSQLVRANDYRFESPVSDALSGASRAYEALVGGAITVAARTTGFVKLLNAAHREFTVGVNPPQAESSLIFVVRDSSNLVVHFEQIATGVQSAFVELPVGSYKFNTYSGRNGRKDILITNPNTLQGTVSNDLIVTVAENQYYLVAATTSTGDSTFQTDVLQKFDLTPSTSLVAGTTEHQLINLLLTPSFSQEVKLLRSTSAGGDLTCATVGGAQIGASTTLAASSGALSNIEIALGAASCTACARSTYAVSATLAAVSPCGRRVTVLIGRPYQLDTMTNVPFCASTFNATTVEIGDLSFIGQPRLSKTAGSSNPLQPPAAVTFEIQNCQCTPPAAPCVEVNTCDTQRIIALGTAVGGVSTAVGGVSTAVGAVGASISVVQTQVRNVNGTLHATRTQLNNKLDNLKNDVGDLSDDVDSLKNDVEDVSKDVGDIKDDTKKIKDDIEEDNKGLLDRVKDLQDECKQACETP